jgi:hypothetical protein
LFAAAGGCDVPSRVSHSTAPPSSVLPLLALDRHRTLRRIVRMCGRAILSRGSVNTIIHVIVDLPLPSPTCVSAALACCLTCAHVAPTAAMLERKIERLGMKWYCICETRPSFTNPYSNNTTPSQVGDNPVFGDAVGNLESHSAWLHFYFLSVGCVGRCRFVLLATKIAHSLSGPRELSAERRLRGTRDSRQRLTTTYTPTIIHNGKFDCARHFGLRRKC